MGILGADASKTRTVAQPEKKASAKESITMILNYAEAVVVLDSKVRSV